jgi:hypothetical protein
MQSTVNFKIIQYTLIFYSVQMHFLHFLSMISVNFDKQNA